MYIYPFEKLKKISKNKKQLWPVIYVERTLTIEALKQDLEVAQKSQVDAVVLEMNKTPQLLEQAINWALDHYPLLKIGVNYLGGDGDLYGYKNSFHIAKKYKLPLVWTDFSGVDLVQELHEESLHAIEALRSDDFFYCSGVHMKYGTLKNPHKSIEQSTLQAQGWVDGIILTGAQTGASADVSSVAKAKQVSGHTPLGIASGITSENILSFKKYADFFLVNTGIADKNHRLDLEKTKNLCELIHAE